MKVLGSREEITSERRKLCSTISANTLQGFGRLRAITMNHVTTSMLAPFSLINIIQQIYEGHLLALTFLPVVFVCT
jgi:hypothetical protein